MDDAIDILGTVIKEARVTAGLTHMDLAAKLKISQRHLMYIENSRQKPGYKLLFRMIRELAIPADLIFYPELTRDRRELEQAIAMLHKCDVKELDVVIATLYALLKEK
jgi:transcriptional regulator with XRE-family HTH domain